MAGYDPNGMSGAVPEYEETTGGEVVPAQEAGALEETGAYQSMAPFGEAKGGKGEGMSQTEKLWLFGEKKPLSVQSYGSLPAEVRLLALGRLAARHPPGRSPLLLPRQANPEDVWHEDLPATNRSFYLVYLSAYLHTFCSCLYTTLGICAIRYIILRGWCGTSATPSWLYGIALVSSVSLNSIWSRFLGFWVSKTGGIRPALLFTQAISAFGGTVLVHAGSPALFVAGLVCMCLQGNPCEALRMRVIAMHTVGENRFNHRFFHRLATWVGAISGLLLMMVLLRFFPNNNATEVSTSPNCPPMDVRYTGAYLYYWQADAPTVFISLGCAALIVNFVLNALFLKVEPWYLDAQKDSMAVMPEMYLGDTMWP